MQLRVASYNIRCGVANDGPNAWPHRKGLTARAVVALGADLIGLQEAYDFQLADLAEALPGYRWVGVGREDGYSGGEHPAIFYQPSRTLLNDWGTFWFSETPAVPGSRHWGNENVRSCTVACFEHFEHFNLHIDHESQPSRLKSVELLLSRIHPDEPSIVTGDFNVHEDNEVIQMMREAGFRDTYRVIHPDEKVVGTFNGWDEALGDEKIDYVFVSPHWEVLNAGIVREKLEGRWPSDHAPVWADIKLR